MKPPRRDSSRSKSLVSVIDEKNPELSINNAVKVFDMNLNAIAEALEESKQEKVQNKYSFKKPAP